jgi:hypothetical protein
VRAPALLSLLAAGWLASGCSPSQRALGEECLKDQDCLSGYCSQLQCAAQPPILDGAAGAPMSDAAPSEGAPLDAASEGDGNQEAASTTEAGAVAEAEAGGGEADAFDDAPTDATDDALSDSATPSAQDSNPAGD